MSVLPTSIQNVIDAFSKIGGIGPRTAERYAYYVHKHPEIATKLADTIRQLPNEIAVCPITFALINSSETVSPLYSDPQRNKQIIAVVAEPFDIIAIEKTGRYKGTYHVLGGLISPIDGVNPESLTIKELTKRAKTDSASEIIVALNSSVEGETTALYIQKQFEGTAITITRLARGIPVGLDLEYADQITLGQALEGRTSI